MKRFLVFSNLLSIKYSVFVLDLVLVYLRAHVVWIVMRISEIIVILEITHIKHKFHAIKKLALSDCGFQR